MSGPDRRLVGDERQQTLQAAPLGPRISVVLSAADFADEQKVAGDEQPVDGFVQNEMIGAVARHVVGGQMQFTDGQRRPIVKRHTWPHQRVRCEGGASQRQSPLVAVRVIRMAVRVDDVSDRERLRAGPLDEDLGRIRRVDQYPRSRFTVTEQVAEVAIAARSDLFENQPHPVSYITSAVRPDGRALALFAAGERLSMTNFLVYLIGTLLVVAGLAYGASRLGISQVWIVAGALVILGIGVMGGIVKTRQKEPS